jgi:hypothetical protein
MYVLVISSVIEPQKVSYIYPFIYNTLNEARDELTKALYERAPSGAGEGIPRIYQFRCDGNTIRLSDIEEIVKKANEPEPFGQWVVVNPDDVMVVDDPESLRLEAINAICENGGKPVLAARIQKKFDFVLTEEPVK